MKISCTGNGGGLDAELQPHQATQWVTAVNSCRHITSDSPNTSAVPRSRWPEDLRFTDLTQLAFLPCFAITPFSDLRAVIFAATFPRWWVSLPWVITTAVVSCCRSVLLVGSMAAATVRRRLPTPRPESGSRPDRYPPLTDTFTPSRLAAQVAISGYRSGAQAQLQSATAATPRSTEKQGVRGGRRRHLRQRVPRSPRRREEGGRPIQGTTSRGRHSGGVVLSTASSLSCRAAVLARPILPFPLLPITGGRLTKVGSYLAIAGPRCNSPRSFVSGAHFRRTLASSPPAPTRYWSSSRESWSAACPGAPLLPRYSPTVVGSHNPPKYR